MTREIEDPWIEPNLTYDSSFRRWIWKLQPFNPLIKVEKSSIFSELSAAEMGSKIDSESDLAVADCTLETKLPNAHLVCLAAQIGDSLDWEGLIKELPEGKILWQLEMQLLPMKRPVSEESTFRALKFSLSEFSKRVWIPNRERSLGVILHSSSLDLRGFYWCIEQGEQLAGWLEDCLDSARHQQAQEVKALVNQGDLEGLRLWAQSHASAKQYVMKMICQYVHYLASSLEEDCPAFIAFSRSNCSLSEQLQLLGQSIFEHLWIIGQDIDPALIQLEQLGHQLINPIATAQLNLQPTLGILIPDGPSLGPDAAGRLAALMQRLKSESIDYRLVREARLTLEWSGLDQLIVLGNALSPLGIRMLRGFAAAGGHIVVAGDKGSLSIESSSSLIDPPIDLRGY